MLNFRKIDKFYLSGGWQEIPGKDIGQLSTARIKAVLDLQFVPQQYDYTYRDWQSPMIAHIIDVLQKNDIEYKSIRMIDSAEISQGLEEILTESQEFLAQMEEKYPGKRENILVKCAAGISRSPTVLINYLCMSRRLSFIEALNYVREKENRAGVEFGASPNYYFYEYLKNKYK